MLEASLHNAPMLKIACFETILTYGQHFIADEAFDSLPDKLALEMLRYFAARRVQHMPSIKVPVLEGGLQSKKRNRDSSPPRIPHLPLHPLLPPPEAPQQPGPMAQPQAPPQPGPQAQPPQLGPLAQPPQLGPQAQPQAPPQPEPQAPPQPAPEPQPFSTERRRRGINGRGVPNVRRRDS